MRAGAAISGSAKIIARAMDSKVCFSMKFFLPFRNIECLEKSP